jgi:dipeptidyl aminopeptidase/acylaminoacyl peptidase
MSIKFNLLFVTLIGLIGTSNAQLDVHFQTPPDEIKNLVDIQPTPVMLIDATNQYGVLFERNAFKGLDELAEEEIRLGGLRIDPNSNGGSRKTYYRNLTVKNLKLGKETPASNLPANPKLSNFSLSPDQKKLAFTHTTNEGITVWVMELHNGNCSNVSTSNVNAVFGTPYTWCPDSESLLIYALPNNRKMVKKALPTGPSVQEATGSKAPVRTYQDLLKNKQDEALFTYYTTSEILHVSLTGNTSPFLSANIYTDITYSPDGNYIMTNTIAKPFSYIVPYYRFPENTTIYDKEGKLVSEFYQKPLIEELPKGFDSVEEGKRSISWRADVAATLYWAEAQDGGDPANEVEYRDIVYTVDAPFTAKPKKLTATKLRFRGIDWGNEKTAILYEGCWKTRRSGVYLMNPSDATLNPKLIVERSTQDVYTNPGNFETEKDKSGRFSLLKFNKAGTKLYLIGEGYSPEGNKPFIDEFSIGSLKTKRLWQADGKSTYESIQRVVDWDKLTLITTIESPQMNPNYHYRTVGKSQTKQITHFPNPYASFMGVSKEKIEYTRKDGVGLSGNLYLPADYDKEKDGRLPVFMWAYPVEFKNADEAGQIKESPHKFTRLFYGSAIYWAARGYAILDNASFPIVGEGETEPNDNFIEQLVANAEAAINKLDELGVADRNRIAVGGHSYGAFMTANLLAHSDLFAAGIARSGAYNRTLTPFGFQSEERTFWDNPDIYMGMSPFTHANKINEPILLIHGDADNNPGTFTLQSERLFGAIKGLGGTSRLVLLPFESHGYAARENILHMLWEMDQWLEKYVKNKVK